jgi:outer membrane protein OmpA-like peptidoglycan-associated protein
MMKKILLAFSVILISLSTKAEENEWFVQIAVYNKYVSAAQFQNIESEIFYSKDKYDFHRYFVGKYDEAGAEAESKKLEALGYNTTVMHESFFNATCTCYKTPLPRKLVSSLQSIFFDFDKYNLRSESKKQLKLLVKSLKENPSLVASLRAHTDAKGNDLYNDRLSKNRAKAAKNYLINKGIPISRIKIETYGERQPIAKNQLENGADTQAGRQFNRRVALEILDKNGNSMSLVEPIYVPSELDVN